MISLVKPLKTSNKHIDLSGSKRGREAVDRLCFF
jgi:hypothetical protein